MQSNMIKPRYIPRVDKMAYKVRAGDIVEFMSEEYFNHYFGDLSSVPSAVGRNMLMLTGSLFKIKEYRNSNIHRIKPGENLAREVGPDYFIRTIQLEIHQNNSKLNDNTVNAYLDRFLFNTAMVRRKRGCPLDFNPGEQEHTFKNSIDLL